MKRIVETILSLLALVLLSPVLLLVAIAVFFDVGSPVLFRQQRPGKDGVPFMLVKFRTMKNAVDKNGVTLRDNQRLTKLGRFLRKISVDELPTLWNVLCGDMSVVGPRPLLMEYLPLYNKEQARRHAVRPGITGWAQVNGRNAISWEEKFKLDVWYVDNHNIWLDVKIILKTFWKVIKSEGVNKSSDVTMDAFKGSSK